MADVTATSRPIVVVGAGAVGLHLAARLAGVAPVTLVARGDRARALAEGGFSLVGSETGEFRVPVLEAGPALQIDPDALVLLATRATQLAEALTALAPRLQPGQAIGVCANGLGVAALAARLAPQLALIRVACWLGAQLEPPARVRVGGVHQLELAADAPARAHLSALQAALTAAGYPVRVADTIAACEWRRSLWNLAVSGLCATLGERNGAILDSPPLHAFARELLVEARKVAAADGVALRDEDFERVFLATRGARDNIGAMLQDLRRGAATEMPFLNAEVARRARLLGVDAPLHAAVARLVAHRELRGAGEGPAT